MKNHMNIKNFINSIDENLIVINKDLIVEYVNDKANKTLEKRISVKDDLIFDVFKVYNLLNDKLIEINYSQILENDVKFGLPEFSIIKTKSGNKFISASFSALKNDRNQIIGIILIFRDITRIMLKEKSFRQYTEALKKSFVGIIILDSDYLIEYINPRGKENLNFKNEAFNKNFFKYYKNDINKLELYHLRKKLKKENNVSKELLFDLNGNCEIWYRLRISKMNFFNEMKYIIVFSDISEKVEIQKKLTREKKILDKIFQQVPNGIILLDKNLKIKLINDYVKEHFYLENTDIEKKLQKIFSNHQDSEENLFKNILRTSSFDNKDEKEYTLLIKGEKYYLDISIIKFFRNGEENYILSILDYTRNKIIEEKLTKSENHLELITNNMLDAITTIDIRGKILYASPSHKNLFGYSPGELIDKNIKDFVCGSSRLDISERFRLIKKGESKRGEYLVYRKDGSQMWVEVTFSLATGSKNEKIIILSRDATERIENRNKLIKAKYLAEKNDRMKGEFLANTSHEIRTPLNGIIGMATVSLEEEIPENVKENIRLIKSSAESLVRIINGILDFSKIESGKMDIHMRRFNLKDLANNIYKNFKYKTKEKNIKITLDYELSKDYYIGDDVRIRQIIINLMGNAIKFTHEGYVRLRVKKMIENEEAINIMFIIEDTGIGIDRKDKRNIFESFSQGDGTYTRKYGGTGLGLSICKMLIDKMHGTIDFESEKGKGSIFQFTLPLAKSFEKVDEEKNEDFIDYIDPLNILLVEDDLTSRKFTKRLLERQGHIVSVSENGVEAVNKVMEKDFDLIFMDIQMPEMDGIKATKIIKKYLKIDDIPIIAITAHARKEEREEILSNGLDDYISKPISINDLKSIIDKNKPSKKEKKVLNINEILNKKVEEIDEIKFDHKLFLEYLKNKNYDVLEKELNKLKNIFSYKKNNKCRNIIFKAVMALRRKDYDKVKELLEKINYNLEEGGADENINS